MNYHFNIKKHHLQVNYNEIFKSIIHSHMGFDWSETLYWLREDTNEFHPFVGDGAISEPLRMFDAINQIDRRQDFHKILAKANKLLVLIEINPTLNVDWR